MSIEIGDTFLYPFPHLGEHLFIVVQNIEYQEGQELAVCVYLTTTKFSGYEDLVCTFKPGDHSFITRPCHIEYSNILKINTQYLEDKIISGISKQYEKMDSDHI